mgnify:CR=1 FL=1
MTARNRYSARITQPRSQGASQAILHGTGLTDAQMNAPQVGITTVWYEGSTCNLHTLDLAAEVKAAAEAAKAKIVSGEIEVHDYSTDSSCPY